MNETIKNIIERRSVKDYLFVKISDGELELILEAGKHAPSGRNMQSAIMVVFKNPENIANLARINASFIGKSFNPFYNAPIVVAVLGKCEISTYVYDGSVVMQNMLLAAHSLGVGACWIHRAKEVFDNEEGKAILKSIGVPDGYCGVAFCILGYAKPKKIEEIEIKDNYVYYDK